jgi:release factor glutamine methyltransferase
MDIYEPAEDSYLLKKYVKQYALGRVLDVGTGSGIQAITAAENKNTREVVAVDINENALKELKEKNIKKIKTVKSDLLNNVDGKFDLIIFNPPYLPQDEGIEDPALYGGKKGWEISEKFFQQVNKHLMPEGKILFLFSSLTNKIKIGEIVENYLLEFKQLEKKKLEMFEELYVYEINKTDLLRELERKHLEDVQYFTHGKRGTIYTAILDKSKYVKTHFAKEDKIKVAIKAERKESKAIERINNEIKWLKVLNKKGIGPRLLFYGKDYFVYKFVEGVFILDYHEDVKKVIINVLKQCRELDLLKVDKEEMHHPLKHIIIGKEIVLLDFERCHNTDHPKNVTQFLDFITRFKELNVNVDELRKMAQEYKKEYGEDVFNKILKYVN